MELDDNLIQQYTCPVCLDILRAPVMQCPKGHTMCQECMEGIISASKTPIGNYGTQPAKCPACRTQLSAENISRNLAAEETMKHLKKKCPNSGCKSNVSFLDFNGHEEKCIHAKLDCTHKRAGCEWRGKRKALANHERTCPYALVADYIAKLHESRDNLQKRYKRLEDSMKALSLAQKKLNERLAMLERRNAFVDDRRLADTYFSKILHLNQDPKNAVNHSRSDEFPMFGYRWRLGIERLRKDRFFGLYLIRLDPLPEKPRPSAAASVATNSPSTSSGAPEQQQQQQQQQRQKQQQQEYEKKKRAPRRSANSSILNATCHLLYRSAMFSDAWLPLEHQMRFELIHLFSQRRPVAAIEEVYGPCQGFVDLFHDCNGIAVRFEAINPSALSRAHE